MRGLLFLSIVALAGCARSAVDLGLVDRRLVPCPRTPNCVSTQEERCGVEPLRYEGSRDAARRRLVEVLDAMPGGRTVTVASDYVRAEFTSSTFRFVDDVEAYLDPREPVIHLRSGARSGIWDLGVNRRRLEEIRSRFEAVESAAARLQNAPPKGASR